MGLEQRISSRGQRSLLVFNVGDSGLAENRKQTQKGIGRKFSKEGSHSGRDKIKGNNRRYLDIQGQVRGRRHYLGLKQQKEHFFSQSQIELELWETAVLNRDFVLKDAPDRRAILKPRSSRVTQPSLSSCPLSPSCLSLVRPNQSWKVWSPPLPPQPGIAGWP